MIDVPYPSPPQCFLTSACKYAPPHSDWPPSLSMKHICDLAQAEYSESEIVDLANNWGALCAKCLQWGHKKISCTARIICINCSAPGHKAVDCNLHLNNKKASSPILRNHINLHPNNGDTSITMDRPHHRLSTVRCKSCGFYGHLAKSCFKRKREQTWKWIPKSSPSSISTPDTPHSTSVSSRGLAPTVTPPPAPLPTQSSAVSPVYSTE